MRRLSFQLSDNCQLFSYPDLGPFTITNLILRSLNDNLCDLLILPSIQNQLVEITPTCRFEKKSQPQQ